MCSWSSAAGAHVDHVHVAEPAAARLEHVLAVRLDPLPVQQALFGRLIRRPDGDSRERRRRPRRPSAPRADRSCWRAARRGWSARSSGRPSTAAIASPTAEVCGERRRAERHDCSSHAQPCPTTRTRRDRSAGRAGRSTGAPPPAPMMPRCDAFRSPIIRLIDPPQFVGRAGRGGALAVLLARRLPVDAVERRRRRNCRAAASTPAGTLPASRARSRR